MKFSTGTLPSHPLVMGILNITPDSFSDGGAFVASHPDGTHVIDVERAVAAAKHLLADGADLIDIGGESSRPGAAAVPVAVECERVVPVVAALRSHHADAIISVDTTKAAVARQAIAAGANVINDISAGRADPAMYELVAGTGAGLVLMHMQGTPQTMQVVPSYQDVVREVRAFFEERLEAAARCGIDRQQLVIDPGIGFGKRREHNLALLADLPVLCALRVPVMVGVSRKSLVGQLLGGAPVHERMEGSLALAAHAAARGARLFRVHDVAETVRFFRAWTALPPAQA